MSLKFRDGAPFAALEGGPVKAAALSSTSRLPDE